MDQSGLDGSIYLEMAERLDAGILPHAELPRHAIELPPLTDPLLHTLTTHAARFAYRRPRRTWAIAAVANAAARVHPQTSPLRRGQAAFHEAAAANLLAELDGKLATATFKTELICIVDMLDRGMLVWRTPERLLTLPPSWFGHQAKRFYEWWYLRQYR